MHDKSNISCTHSNVILSCLLAIPTLMGFFLLAYCFLLINVLMKKNVSVIICKKIFYNSDKLFLPSDRYLIDFKLPNVVGKIPVIPLFPLIKNIITKNDVVTYEAIFHVKIIKPWESLEKISLSTPIVGGFEKETTSACKVDKGACETQLQSITSVFHQLQADFDNNTHECSWPGVVCDDQNIIIKLHIGKKFCLYLYSICMLPYFSCSTLSILSMIFQTENKNDTEKGFPQECAELHHLTDLFLSEYTNHFQYSFLIAPISYVFIICYDIICATRNTCIRELAFLLK